VVIRTEPLLMSLRGYRELSRREKARLYPLLKDAGRRMGLPVVPELWISDAQKPGAWAHMRGIVVTRGLLGDYDASEAAPKPDLDDTALTAILAHELHHWDCGDVVGLTHRPSMLLSGRLCRQRNRLDQAARRVVGNRVVVHVLARVGMHKARHRAAADTPLTAVRVRGRRTRRQSRRRVSSWFASRTR